MPSSLSVFFFNDTATTEIYTLSLHDALPIYLRDYKKRTPLMMLDEDAETELARVLLSSIIDRKSTRLNSSHGYISYAVFCLKKKIVSQYCSGHRPAWTAHLRRCHTYGDAAGT